MLNASLGGVEHVMGLGEVGASPEAIAASSSSSAAGWDVVVLTICFVTLNTITIVSAYQYTQIFDLRKYHNSDCSTIINVCLPAFIPLELSVMTLRLIVDRCTVERIENGTRMNI